MKKTLLSLSALFLLGFTNVNAQCNVTLSTQKTKFCSDDKTTLTATSSDIKTVPNFSDQQQVFNVADLKLDQMVVGLIQSGMLKGMEYPFNSSNGKFSMAINGVNLQNAAIASGEIVVSVVTDLKQDLNVVFELPGFTINGKTIKDSIYVNGKDAGPGMVTFSKSFDLTNAVADFTGGTQGGSNTIKYVVKPSILITTTTFTNKEVGDLKIELKNLTLTENTSYKWYKDNVLLADLNSLAIDVNESGTYKVETNSNCGFSTDYKVIQVVDMPSKSVTTGNLTFCEGDSVKLSADGNGTYNWSTNELSKDIYVSKSGTYYVAITNDICTNTSDAIQVTVNPNPEVKLNYNDTTIVIGSQITLKASGAKNYIWNDNSKLDSLVVKQAGSYTVIGKNDAGCTSTASIKVEVREKGAGLVNLNKIKVAISPNPTSDVLHITVDEFKNKTVSIVDLKGNLVYNQSLNSVNTSIDVNSFAKGMYLLNIVDAANSVVNSQRFVVE
jgi:hypothetical protein